MLGPLPDFKAVLSTTEELNEESIQDEEVARIKYTEVLMTNRTPTASLKWF